MSENDFRVWASCTDCGWVGPKITLRRPESLWRRHAAVRLVSAMYWWHVAFGTKHTHWEWSK